MTRWVRMTGLFAAIWLLASTSAAVAGPWLEAGDKQVRQDVELLKAAGLIEGPVNAWPLPWMQVAAGLERAQGQTLPPHLAAAVDRLERLADRDEQKSRYEADVRVTNRAALVRDFGDTARQDVDAEVKAEHDLGPLTIAYGVGYRNKQEGSDVHFEPAHAALKLGNWAFYGGYVDTWWGPGNDSALLFSTNPRPFPRVGFKRLATDPVDFPVLRWLGPWRFDLFAGILREQRNDFDNPGIIGMRLSFEPAPGFEIGLNRGLQLCGTGRPCAISTIFHAVVGFGNADNTGTPNEPGNQLAGFDLSYTRMIGGVGAKIYTEWEAEDEDNFIVDKYARLAGLTLTGPLGGGGASWTLLGEWSDTLAIKFLGTARYPGVLYQHFIYTDGFTFHDRALGHSLNGDSDLWTAGLSVTDAKNRRYYGIFRRANINKTLRNNNISADRETFDLLTAGVAWPTAYGDLSLEGRYDTDSPNTPGRKAGKGAVEFGWRTRF